MRSLSNYDGEVNENGKKSMDLDKQNNNFAGASRFFVRFSAVVARLQRETFQLNLTFSRERGPKTALSLYRTLASSLVWALWHGLDVPHVWDIWGGF